MLIFYNEMSNLEDVGRPVYVVCLGTSKVFDMISHKILMKNQMKYGLDEQSVR